MSPLFFFRVLLGALHCLAPTGSSIVHASARGRVHIPPASFRLRRLFLRWAPTQRLRRAVLDRRIEHIPVPTFDC